MPGDLAAATDEVLDGLAALEGAGLGRRGDPAARRRCPGRRRPRRAARGRRGPGTSPNSGSRWRPPSPTGPGPSWRPTASRAARRSPRSARWRPPNTPASTAPTTGRPGARVADAWQVASQPYREAYARLREAEAAVRAGRREQAAGPWQRARPWPAACRRLRCSASPRNWPGGPGWPRGPSRRRDPRRPGAVRPHRPGDRGARPARQRATATARSRVPCSSASARLPCMCPGSLTSWGCATAPRRRRSARGWRWPSPAARGPGRAQPEEEPSGPASLQIGTDPTSWYLPPADYDAVAAG